MGSAGIVFIVIGTLITGAANSLFTKFQDNQCVKHCNSPDVSRHKNFEQPALQSLQMFMGELAVLVVYYLVYRTNIFNRNKDYEPIDPEEEEETHSLSVFENISLAIPAVCDLCATTVFNIGLVYTPVSIYQMTRGSVVLFVAIMSVLFLKRKISKLEWVSLFIVSLGVAVVGLSGSNNSKGSESAAAAKESSALVLFGVILIVAGSVIQALQFVVEEHILSKKAVVPLKLVYCEGFYGFTILLFVMVVLNFIIGSLQPASQFEDSPFNIVEAFSQFFYRKEILVSSICIMISIAGFNFFGISITHRLSATARSTVDTCRTLIVWLLAITMGWESFHLLQFVGFVLLVFGTLVFNGVLTPEEWRYVPKFLKTEPRSHLLEELEEHLERT